MTGAEETTQEADDTIASKSDSKPPADLPEPIRLPEEHTLTDSDSDEETTEKLRRQGVRIGKGSVAPRVFWPALLIILAVAVIAIAAPGVTSDATNAIQNWIVANLGWYYMLIVGGFVFFVIALGASRLGRIKLGRDDEEPEFGVLSWFAMLFAAGMGIGLVFYGVGEPLTYATVQPKPGWDNAEGADGAGLAMAQTFIHWGLHPWAIYAVIGLSLAYAIHRRGRPISIRWALEPIFGERVKGWVGDVIDVLAIFGTVFGVATSLGLGVQQISRGMEAIGVVESADKRLLVILIVIITFLATLSVVSGVGAGIKWLSNINLSMAGILLVAVLVLGPTLFLLQNFVEALGVYLANFFSMTFDVGAYQRSAESQEWFSGWTIFYWGWWIAWAPFVGVFIARISRGRTIREFVAGVLIVPTLVGMIWFSVLGGSGIYRELFGPAGLVENGEVSPEGSLFQVLEALPAGGVLSVIAIILVAIFFITSSDSGSLVVDMLASGGHPNPPTWSRIVWAVLEGALAISLLLAGGLQALQAGSLATALPFSVILVLMGVATLKTLRKDMARHDLLARQERLDRAASHVTRRLTKEIHRIPEIEQYVDDRIDYRLSRTRGVISSRGRKPGSGGPPR